jgi:rhodanese-related sulfurtransferase
VSGALGGVTGAVGSAADATQAALSATADAAGAQAAAAQAALASAAAAAAASAQGATAELVGAAGGVVSSALGAAAAALPGPLREALAAAAPPAADLLGRAAHDPVTAAVLVVVGILAPAALAWRAAYGGYAGLVAPAAAAAALEAGAPKGGRPPPPLLVDLRAESARARDGVPDLRFAARGRGVVVPPPALPPRVARAARGGAAALEASVAGALVAGLAKADPKGRIFLLDGGDGKATAVARAARAAGVRGAFVVEGGFPAWRAAGLAVAPRPDFDDSPGAVLGDAVAGLAAGLTTSASSTAAASPLAAAGLVSGLAGATMVALNLKAALEVVGVLGLGLTLGRRLLSYESPADLAADIGAAVEGAAGVVGKVVGAVGGGGGEKEEA